MKNLFLFLLLVICCSCSFQTTIIINIETFDYQYDIGFIDRGVIDNCQNVSRWIYYNIQWESNTKTPNIKRIMSERKGDCKDMSFLMIDMLNYYFDYKVSIVNIFYHNKNVGHTVCLYHDTIYDITNNKFMSYLCFMEENKDNEIYIYSYDKAIKTYYNFRSN
jgi:hypothetical protein